MVAFSAQSSVLSALAGVIVRRYPRDDRIRSKRSALKNLPVSKLRIVASRTPTNCANCCSVIPLTLRSLAISPPRYGKQVIGVDAELKCCHHLLKNLITLLIYSDFIHLLVEKRNLV